MATPPPPKPAKISVIPPTFAGRINEDPYKYLQKFELAARANCWTDTHKALALPNYLTDTANLWFIGYKKFRDDEATQQAGGASTQAIITWGELTKALQLAFKTVASKEVAEEKLYSRKQQVGESPEDYVYSKLDLINDYDPSMSEESKVRHLIKGLRPSYLEKVYITNPQTVEDVMKTVRRIAESQFLLAHQVDSNPAQTITPPAPQPSNDHLKEFLDAYKSEMTNLIKAEVNNIKSQLGQINPFKKRGKGPNPQPNNQVPFYSNMPAQSFPRINNTNPNSLSCRYCKRLGHTIDQCLTRLRNNARRQPNNWISNPPVPLTQPPIYRTPNCYVCGKSGHLARQCNQENQRGWSRQPQRIPPNPTPTAPPLSQ